MACPFKWRLLEISAGFIVAVALNKVFTEFQQVVIHDSLADFLHKVYQEVEVVIASQADAEGLVRFEQVADIGPRVVGTCVAVTVVVKRREIFLKLGIFKK